MERNTKISCPNCGYEFNVEDVLGKQIEEKHRVEFNKKITDFENDFNKKKQELNRKEEELKQKQNEITEQVEQLVKIESSKKEKELKSKLEKDYESQLKILSEEAIEAKKELKEYKETKIENEQLKRKLEEQKQDLQLEFQKELNVKINEEIEKISKRETEKALLPLKEKEMTIASLKQQIDDLKRTSEQGSEQLQGEAQELLVEETLKSMFPFDLIEPVEKGIRGADIIHTVRNKIGADCGKIIYEIKRTKSFNDEWISKLKMDAVSVKANIFVIVTESLPEGIDKIGVINDVWICSFKDYKGLVLPLRDSMIKINEVASSEVNKGEKMQMLYNYIMSPEFMLQMGAIVDGFRGLQNNYMKERTAMQKIWKERETQLERILLNTNHFIGKLQGIGGSSMPNLKQIGSADNILELEE